MKHFNFLKVIKGLSKLKKHLPLNLQIFVQAFLYYTQNVGMWSSSAELTEGWVTKAPLIFPGLVDWKQRRGADGASLCGHTLAWLELLCYWKLGSTLSRGEIFQMIINNTFLVRAELEYCTIETGLLDWKMIQLNNFENILDWKC